MQNNTRYSQLDEMRDVPSCVRECHGVSQIASDVLLITRNIKTSRKGRCWGGGGEEKEEVLT